MSAYQKDIAEKKKQVIQEYYLNLQEKEKFFERDTQMAISIQKQYKKFFIQKFFNQINHQQFKKQQGLSLLNKDIYKKNSRILIRITKNILIIKQHFRGYYCRKFIHDFYARQKFLNRQKVINDNFLNELRVKAQEEEVFNKKMHEALAKSEFMELTKNLHHLSSTKTLPGIYNNPYQSQKPQAFGISIENHLKQCFKVNYQWTPPNSDSIQLFKAKNKPKQVQSLIR